MTQEQIDILVQLERRKRVFVTPSTYYHFYRDLVNDGMVSKIAFPGGWSVAISDEGKLAIGSTSISMLEAIKVVNKRYDRTTNNERAYAYCECLKHLFGQCVVYYGGMFRLEVA